MQVSLPRRTATEQNPERILFDSLICKKGKNLEIHLSFVYSWANYEKNKEISAKSAWFCRFGWGRSFDGVGKGLLSW